MKKRVLTAIITGAITLFSASAASSQELRASSYQYNRNSLPTHASIPYVPILPLELNLTNPYTQTRGGDLLDVLADMYEASEIGKRRQEKLKLKREGLPDFETYGQAMAPRKAGKAGMHLNISSNDDYRMRLYAEAYLMRDQWTRVKKPGFQITFKINY